MAQVIDHCTHPFGLHEDYGTVTQEVTVLRAKDGSYITLGESGYGEDGVKYTITGLGKEYVWGRTDGSTIDKRLKPEWLTSKHPDSWEQLEKELMSAMLAYCSYGHDSEKCMEYTTCGSCRKDCATDIIRRAKALAGVE